MPTLLTAGDGTNGAVITSANDNALTIQTGPNGGKVNAIALASDGTATLLQPPKLAATATVSMVRLNTDAGFGSASTAIRRFTNVVTNQGSDITYADSATLGASFTINTAGVYSINWSDAFAGAYIFGISLNTTQPATEIASLTNIGEVLAMNTTGGANIPGSVSWTGYLPVGSVIRAHMRVSSAAATPTQSQQFTIVRVA